MRVEEGENNHRIYEQNERNHLFDGFDMTSDQIHTFFVAILRAARGLY